jgi:hypothetical protein
MNCSNIVGKPVKHEYFYVWSVSHHRLHTCSVGWQTLTLNSIYIGSRQLEASNSRRNNFTIYYHSPTIICRLTVYFRVLKTVQIVEMMRLLTYSWLAHLRFWIRFAVVIYSNQQSQNFSKFVQNRIPFNCKFFTCMPHEWLHLHVSPQDTRISTWPSGHVLQSFRLWKVWVLLVNIEHIEYMTAFHRLDIQKHAQF